MTATVKVLGGLILHELFAVTDTDPPVDPTVVTIEFVVEFPVHPEGKDQV